MVGLELFRRGSLSLVLATLLPGVLSAQDAPLAQTPPMGWNSWDAYGTNVREEEVKANADAMARSLSRFVCRCVVVEIR